MKTKLPSATKIKFRPVLTASQILHIIEFCKKERPQTDMGFSIQAALVSFKDKIEDGTITPSYQTKTPLDISLEELGFTDDDVNSSIDIRLSKETYWKECFNKYTRDPNSCSVKQIAAADEHRYLNDLMSDKEIIDFEKKDKNGES